MKTCIIVFLSLISPLCAKPGRYKVAAAKAIITEQIPHFAVKEASFEKALAALREIWDKAHPSQAFPVAVTDFEPPDGAKMDNPAEITLELRDVTYLEVFRYLANLSGRHMSQTDGIYKIVGWPWIQEDWIGAGFEVKPVALARLGLQRNSSTEKVRAALKRYDISLEQWMRPSLHKSGRLMVVVCEKEQKEQIAGLLHLLNNGFNINK